MARPKTITVDPANEDGNGYGNDVTGASFTLTANDAGDGLAHIVSILNNTANSHAGKTVTLVGTDADGEALTEVVTGPGASATVVSTEYFLTLASATPSATIGADTFDIGWADEVITQTIPLDFYASTTATLAVYVSGTINFTVQETFQSVLTTVSPVQNITWRNIGPSSNKTVNTVNAAVSKATGVHLIINSYSDGAEATMTILQGTRGSN
jgi:hypothetical protein